MLAVGLHGVVILHEACVVTGISGMVSKPASQEVLPREGHAKCLTHTLDHLQLPNRVHLPRLSMTGLSQVG